MYNALQVLLILGQLFHAFLAASMMKRSIDHAHYLSAPQMAWEAMKKKTIVGFDLISDPANFLMIESLMDAGVCLISKITPR